MGSVAEPGANLMLHAPSDQGKPQDAQDAVRVGLDHVSLDSAAPDGLAPLRTARAGVLVAVMAALSVNLGKVCQKRGTQDLPVLLFKFSVCIIEEEKEAHDALPSHSVRTLCVWVNMHPYVCFCCCLCLCLCL